MPEQVPVRLRSELSIALSGFVFGLFGFLIGQGELIASSGRQQPAQVFYVGADGSQVGDEGGKITATDGLLCGGYKARNACDRCNKITRRNRL